MPSLPLPVNVASFRIGSMQMYSSKMGSCWVRVGTEVQPPVYKRKERVQSPAPQKQSRAREGNLVQRQETVVQPEPPCPRPGLRLCPWGL